jgi:hypothetical protein
MITIRGWAALEVALCTPLGDRLKSLLCLRRDQLAEWGEIVTFVIVEPGDDSEQIEPSPLINLLDGRRFGDPAFTPSWEHIQDHNGIHELTFVLSDDVRIPTIARMYSDLMPRSVPI